MGVSRGGHALLMGHHHLSMFIGVVFAWLILIEGTLPAWLLCSQNWLCLVNPYWGVTSCLLLIVAFDRTLSLFP